MVTPTNAAAPTAEFIEAFNAQLREAKTEALNVLVAIMRLDTDKDIAIRTQQRLAATAILRVKEMKPPKPPREPRAKTVKAEQHSSPMSRSLRSLDPESLIALAEQAFAPDSTVSSRDQIRIAMRVVNEEARRARAEMKMQRAQARALRRKPET